jgi:hypothetical protein
MFYLSVHENHSSKVQSSIRTLLTFRVVVHPHLDGQQKSEINSNGYGACSECVSIPQMSQVHHKQVLDKKNGLGRSLFVCWLVDLWGNPPQFVTYKIRRMCRTMHWCHLRGCSAVHRIKYLCMNWLMPSFWIWGKADVCSSRIEHVSQQSELPDQWSADASDYHGGYFVSFPPSCSRPPAFLMPTYVAQAWCKHGEFTYTVVWLRVSSNHTPARRQSTWLWYPIYWLSC